MRGVFSGHASTVHPFSALLLLLLPSPSPFFRAIPSPSRGVEAGGSGGNVEKEYSRKVRARILAGTRAPRGNALKNTRRAIQRRKLASYGLIFIVSPPSPGEIFRARKNPRASTPSSERARGRKRARALIRATLLLHATHTHTHTHIRARTHTCTYREGGGVVRAHARALVDFAVINSLDLITWYYVDTRADCEMFARR